MLHTFRLCAFQDPPLPNCHSILATTSSNLAAVLHLESWKMLSSNPCNVIMFSIHQGSEASGIKMCHSMSYLTVSLIKKGAALLQSWWSTRKKKHAISCHPTAHFTPPIQLFQHPTIPGGRFNVASHFTRDMFSHRRGLKLQI